MTEHAPRRWGIAKAWGYNQITNRGVKVDTVFVGEWGRHKVITQFCPTCPFSNAEAESIAHLIAAAPQQHALLVDIVEGAYECHNCGGTGKDDFESLSACRECGGTGECCDVGPLLPSIRAAIAAVQQQKGGK